MKYAQILQNWPYGRDGRCSGAPGNLENIMLRPRFNGGQYVDLRPSSLQSKRQVGFCSIYLVNSGILIAIQGEVDRVILGGMSEMPPTPT